MADLNLQFLELNNLLKSSTAEEAVNYIKEHLSNIGSVGLSEHIKIPSGLSWFNVSQPLREDDLAGKIVILDFFTYCCINCIHILPTLKALEEKHAESNVIAVIGVHSPKFENEKNEANLLNALVKLEISHPVVNDPEAGLWNELDITCWPTLLVLDPTGRPIMSFVGEGHSRELNLFINVALEQYQGALRSRPLPLSRTRQPVAASLLSYPGAVTSSEKVIAVADTGHHRVLLVTSSGDIQEVIGGPSAGLRDGNLSESRFRAPQGLAFHGADKLYVADTGNHCIRLIDLHARTVTTIVGTGQQGSDLLGGETGLKQPICSPWGLCIAPAPVIAQQPTQPSVSLVYAAPSVTGGPPLPPPPPITNISGPPLPPPMAPPPPMMPTPPMAPPMMSAVLTKKQDAAPNNGLHGPDVLLIAMSGCHQIWAYFFQDTVFWKGKLHKKGSCAAIVGTGVEGNRNNSYPHQAELAQPSGICFSAKHNSLFIADSESSSVRRVCLQTGAVTAVVGGHTVPTDLFSFGDVDGTGTTARLQHPLDVAFDPDADCLLVTDSYNHKLKKINVETRQCSSISLDRELHEPAGVCLFNGGYIIADTNAHTLLAVQKSDYTTKQIELKMLSTVVGKSRIRRVWVTTVPIAPLGSDVTLSLNLGSHFSGRWQVAPDNPTTVRWTETTGSVEAGTGQVRFFTDSSDELALDLDLAECSGDACFMRYFRLLARPSVSPLTPTITSVHFTPDLDR